MIHNRCHDLLMVSVNLNDISILKIKNADFCCITSGICKSKAIITENSNLNQKTNIGKL